MNEKVAKYQKYPDAGWNGDRNTNKRESRAAITNVNLVALITPGSTSEVAICRSARFVRDKAAQPE